MSRKKNKNDWLNADDREVKRIERMIRKKEAKELGKWLKKWRKQGKFWT